MLKAPFSHSQRGKLMALSVMLVLYACATLQFIRFYVVDSRFYLRLPAYLAGHERLPFQERVLPIPLIDGLNKLPLIGRAVTHTKGAFTPQLAAVYVLSLIAMVIAGFFTQRLYLRLSRSRSLVFLVYPVFLFAMMWTYAIHLEANFFYPYDILSVAFFSAGLYYIYTRSFWPLVAVMILGTFNRETTLFLVGIYVLDSMTPLRDTIGRKFSLNLVSWPKVILLLALWVTIKVGLAHAFAHNNRAEDYIRLRQNLGLLKPRLWPALLNACGYILPIVLLFRRDIQPVRFRNYLWILPAWIAGMFYSGVIVETRLYGELCPYAAIAVVLIMERRVEARRDREPAAAAALPRAEMVHVG